MHLPYDPYLRPDFLRTTRNRLLTRVSDPVSELLTLDEAKLYLRIDDSDNDTLISDLIIATRVIAENWLKRSLITQSWKVAYDYGIPAALGLPMGPVNSITSVVIINKDTTTQTLDSGSYWLNAAQNTLELNSGVLGFRIEITYSAGYGAASAVPKPIKQGMLAHIAALYDSRGEAGDVELPPQAVGLYTPFREIRL